MFFPLFTFSNKKFFLKEVFFSPFISWLRRRGLRGGQPCPCIEQGLVVVCKSYFVIIKDYENLEKRNNNNIDLNRLKLQVK
ncbi:MAG: hypothetical protein DYG83_01725 [Candidatus Brocadia sp. AMX2]|uniref:Transcriptional regulator n=1 Tax=Candidatus Brocadia sinica JPN1 TaxID=1197129 RepID=A0ABQ0JVF2_9BACT|nr:MAG: hypothetical protein EDM70_01010 [Candidatus Brocadia sp. AMX2]KXK33486.1 MAG: hypothetical protein UZ01_00072 [Candidatus Brocadia sinica]MBC6930868.1 hypothetical protein [Candidatus Brocadia sp.]MBL1167837.1 hypothetical protein [Candidatus Brocadia sp. AMX1]GAN32685.1 transcriptional regulator [Candidatus Brocadia sinica JPN1]